MRIILASNSPRRKELLELMGLNFEVMPSSYEEKDIYNTPEETVKMYSYSKAIDIKEKITGDAILIAADTIVYFDEIMGKPQNAEDAFYMIKKLSGNTHSVFTGVTIINNETGKHITKCVETRVTFMTLSDSYIREYVKNKDILNKAGAYAIQEEAALFIEKIEGCYYNVVGLPISMLVNMLSEFGFNLL